MGCGKDLGEGEIIFVIKQITKVNRMSQLVKE